MFAEDVAVDLYHEMRKYRTGFDDAGNSQFSIPLKIDEKYKRQAGLWTRAGAEVPVDKKEVLEAVSVVEKVIRGAAALLGV